jgi:hypothetical protein
MVSTNHTPISTFFAMAALVAATACGTSAESETTSSGASGTAPPPVQEGAAARFWEAFHEGDHAAIADVRRALDDELAAGPDAYATFLRAHVDLWELVEVVGLGDDPSAKAALAFAALENFERAMEASPSDVRLHAWHGLLVTGVAEATGNGTMYEAGIEEIELAATGDSGGLVGGFTLMSVLARNAPSDPRFEAAVEATWQMMERCVGDAVDRQDPDMTGLPIAGACQNTSMTPHAWEGFWLSAGDVLAKAGQREVATTLYDNAKLGPDFASWRYQPELEQRLDDLDARIAAYADLDPFNDPPLGASALCNGCHTASVTDRDP